MLNKQIYYVGMRLRNPSLISYLYLLKKHDQLPIEYLRKYQIEKCKTYLQFVKQYSPYYKKLFDKLSFDPSLIKSVDEIKKIPIINKSDLISKRNEIQTIYKFNKLLLSETSGTSGQGLKFYRNEEWDSHNRAAMLRGYSWFNVEPWERNGYFWGYNINKKGSLKTKMLDGLQNRYRLFSYKEAEIKKFITKLKKASYLHGYSSMIYETAKIINRLGMEGEYSLKMIKGTSEKIFDSYQTEVQLAFGGKIISEYGSSESGLIAFECPSGSMHINMENVIVEEENGEIIVTNLLSKSFPIIRYRLGDSIKLAPDGFVCKCGRAHPVLLEVLGRVGKSIIGKRNHYPSLTFYYVFKNLALNNNITLNYQAIQKESGKIQLKIEQPNHGYHDVLYSELAKYFSDDIEFSVEFNQVLHTMDSKLRDFITYLQ